MGLLTRIFGNGKEREGGAPQTSQFHESESSNEGEPSRNAPHRELVQVVMRDTMRKHGIPTDWMECRILSTVNPKGRAGLHANFVVKQAHEQMLSYVFAFQESFETELARFDARARDWLMSIGWEFQGHAPGTGRQASSWKPGIIPSEAGADSGRPPLVEHRAFVPPDDAMAEEVPKSDEGVERDLQALFAIRDAAIAQSARREDQESEQPDFEATRPFEDGENPEKKG